MTGVGGNGAAMQTGDPEGRECSQLGYDDVQYYDQNDAVGR